MYISETSVHSDHVFTKVCISLSANNIYARHGLPGQTPTDTSPSRFPLVGNHSIIIVDMPEMKEILKAMADEIPQALRRPVTPREGSVTPVTSGEADPSPTEEQPLPPPQDLVGRTLPLLFIRAYDGVGYHSGRTITLENIFAQLNLAHAPGVDANWLSAAQQAVGTELGGWTLRVL
jgi:recombining binding protein suppressor of hairless